MRIEDLTDAPNLALVASGCDRATTAAALRRRRIGQPEGGDEFAQQYHRPTRTLYFGGQTSGQNCLCPLWVILVASNFNFT